MANSLAQGTNEISFSKTFRQYKDQDTTHTTEIKDLKARITKLEDFIKILSSGMVVEKIEENGEITNIEFK